MASNVYEEIEHIITEKIHFLENENTRLHDENIELKTELACANAKLEVYERLASISDTKTTLGFGPPISKEGSM